MLASFIAVAWYGVDDREQEARARTHVKQDHEHDLVHQCECVLHN